MSKKEGRWKNPKPKTETLTPTPERKMGKREKDKRKRKRSRGEPNASFPIRQKRRPRFASRALGLRQEKGSHAYSSAPRPVEWRINHMRASHRVMSALHRIMSALEPKYPPKTTSQRIYTTAPPPEGKGQQHFEKPLGVFMFMTGR